MTNLSTRDTLLQHAASVPLNEMDVSDFDLHEHNATAPYFERLRHQDPVHYLADSPYGPFWSITKYDDIKAVHADNRRFSSEGSIHLEDRPEDYKIEMFLAMDEPRHGELRRAVFPAVSPKSLGGFEDIIRARAITILDSLPVGETFNWVERVSVEFTTQMLATLFNFPFEDRAKLTRWSDAAMSQEMPDEQRLQEFTECYTCFAELWKQRSEEEPSFDMISMLAHSDVTKDMVNNPMELLGNILLLIVGGNDTTRNSISGGVLALNEFPKEYQKLRENLDVIPNMVSEIIRWQTPFAYTRRTALEDVELGGKLIKKGDKVAAWYASGNRDETVFPEPEKLIVDRPNARDQISFGFGVHHCMGSRFAEMQLRILWEEIMQRFEFIEVVGEAQRVRSNIVRGYSQLPVRLHPPK
ncbi:linalool 8-monooxygenase [Rhodobiaceae bacterium]|nr:linalool 8-monooxygenase [Rhodobiaceae bacterium]